MQEYLGREIGDPVLRAAVLGIRPEEFSILRGDAAGADGPVFEVAPEIIGPMGAHTLVTFTIGSRELQARVGGKERLEVGAPLRLSCPAQAVHLFDPATEAAVSADGQSFRKPWKKGRSVSSWSPPDLLDRSE